MAMPVAPSVVLADSISEVEGARAKERAYRPLSRQDVEKLRRYGGNDDYAPAYGYGVYGYGGGYYDDHDGYQPGYRTYRTYPY
jgi:hypothetical protein